MDERDRVALRLKRLTVKPKAQVLFPTWMQCNMAKSKNHCGVILSAPMISGAL